MNHSDTKEFAGFFTVSSTGILLDCSYHFLQITGYSVAEVIGQSLQQFLTNTSWENVQSGDYKQLELKSIAQEWTTVETHPEEVTFRGESAWQIRFQPEPEEYIENKASGSLDEWTLMSKILSHDLREPLRKILLYIDMIRGNTKNQITPESLMLLQITNDQSYQAMQLLDAIRQYVSFSTTSKLLVKSIDLNEVLDKSWMRVYDENGLKESLLEKPHLPVIRGQGAMIQALFYQILDNSVKYSEPRRPLQIKVESSLCQEDDQEMVEIRFRDNGIGFDDMYSEDVFRLFNQLNRSSSGCGAGLAICKKIVESHQGQIAATSQPGEGTTLTIKLPLKPH